MTDFRPLHKKITKKILSEIEQFFDDKIEEAKGKDEVLADMVKVLQEFVMRGGKRIRPFLTVLAYQYATSVHESAQSQLKDHPNVFQAAACVEIHHLYILNLDDMADRDVLRHGGPTLEEYYGTKIFGKWSDAKHHGQTFSSIAGALLNSYTWEILRTSGFDPQIILNVMGIITESLFTDTVLGWQIHYFQNNQTIAESTEERFLKGLEYVTSRYTFVGPLNIGLTLAGKKPNSEIQKVFIEYGKHIGIAFQIQDDILGLFGDPNQTGKAVGNDVREGKKTLLIQRAYRNGNAEQRTFLESVIGTELTVEQLQKVQTIVKDTGSLEYSQQLAKQHVEQGRAALKKLPKRTEEIEVLESLAEYIITRKK